MRAVIALDQKRLRNFVNGGRLLSSPFSALSSATIFARQRCDVLATFASDADWSLFHHDMQEELSDLFGRKVDLVSRRAIERSHNWIRRKAILNTAEQIYVA
jgi:hypothetical protein